MGKKNRRNQNTDGPIEEPVFNAAGEIETEVTPEPKPEPEPQPVNFAESAEPEPEPAPRTERRGRPKGSKNAKRKPERETETPENFGTLLLSCHQMMAALISCPEVLLTDEEAQRMGKAIAEVNALYGDTSWLSPEIRAWGNLGIVAIVTYAPRYFAIQRRLKAEANGEDKRPIEVTPINSRGAAAATTATH